MKTTHVLVFSILTILLSASLPLLAQPALQSVRLTNSNTQLRFDVAGGNGPFAIERATSSTTHGAPSPP